MAQQSTATRTKSRQPRPLDSEGAHPTWEIAYLFPMQGSWTKDEYLALEGLHGSYPLVELSNGRLEVLPVPTQLHQFIMLFLIKVLETFAQAHAPGVVLCSGMRVRLAGGRTSRFREPDVLYMKAKHNRRRHEEFWDGADLVMEIVSGDAKDRKRDLVTKVREYARARIPEYWIIDPEQRFVRVLTLNGQTYKLHGEFGPGSQATSVLLPGFAVDVDTVLNPPGSTPAS